MLHLTKDVCEQTMRLLTYKYNIIVSYKFVRILLSRGDKLTKELLDMVLMPAHSLKETIIYNEQSPRVQLLTTLRHVYRGKHIFDTNGSGDIYNDIVYVSPDIKYNVKHTNFVCSKEQYIAIEYAVHKGLDYSSLLLRTLDIDEVAIVLDSVTEGIDLTPFINANLTSESLLAILDGIRSGLPPQAFANGFYRGKELIRILKTLRDARILRYCNNVINILTD